jgi:hypothetical protein
MRDEDAIALVVMLVIGVVALTVYIGLILLGVISRSANRSPHWMWFDPPDGIVHYPNRDGLPAPARRAELWTGIEPERSSLRLLRI